MAALWGGGAGHAGAGGTLPLRGGAEPAVGNALPSTQYLLAENLHFSLEALEAETILEAEELLGTMQGYLDSSVISIIEDFSGLTEARGRADADNERSLLTAITEILDSTDDESLSPFDTIPDSELLTSPKEPDNSSFQRFLSLSRTPPKQDFRSTIEDFQEPRICTFVTEKVEARTTSLPSSLTPNCPKDRAASNKAGSKGSRGERRVFRHRERDAAILQYSDGEEEEEEEEEITGCGPSFEADVKEIPAASARKEVETDLPPSDGLCIIAPERISLSELVRSMHPYCQPDFAVCLSPKSQPRAVEPAACPVVSEVVPDDGESPAVLQNADAELSCRTDSSDTSGQAKEADPLGPSLDEVLCTDHTKPADTERDLALGGQADGVGMAVVQRKEDAHLGPKEGAEGSTNDRESTSQRGRGALRNIRPSASETDKRSGNTRKNGKKCSKEKRRHGEARNGRPPKQAGAKPSSGEKPVQKAAGRGQAEPSPDEASRAEERQGTAEEEEEELFKHGAELESPNPLTLGLESAEALPGTEECPRNQYQGDTDALPADQSGVQEPHCGSKPLSPTNEVVGPDTSPLLPGSIVDIAGRPPRNDLGSEETSCPPKEAKPRPLSLSEYRQRRKQHQPGGEGTSSPAEKQRASKWPSLPEPPTELADLPCLLVPPPPPKLPVPGPGREPEKPAGTASTPAPADKAAAAHLSVQTTMAAPVLAPCSQNGTLSTPSLPAPAPVVPPQPSKAGAFPHVGAQVPPILPPAYLPSAPGAFLPAPPNPCLFSAPPPVPPWSPFAPLPAGYQSLPPPSLVTEVCSPAFHTVPPVPPPTWPPPPVPLPSFGPGLPYTSIKWAAGPPPPPYWPGIPVPPPMLPIPYGDQGVHLQTPEVGAFLTPPCSEETSGQQSTAPTPDSSQFRMQNLAATEKAALPAQLPGGEPPSTAKITSRRISDPRRQAQPSAAESKAEVAPGKSQPLGKLLSPASVVEPLGKPAPTQPVRKSSVMQSVGEPHSVLPSQQVKDSIGLPKPLEEPSSAEPVEKAYTVPAAVQGAKETPPAAQSQELPPLPAALVPEKLTVPAAVEMDAKEATCVDPSSPATAGTQKVQETGPLSKTPTHMLKPQPFTGIAHPSRNKEIVQAFITEIGIEASDLSSLLEQFEKTEVKEDASDVAKSKGSIAAGNSGSEALPEKKMVDRLQAPELTNVAGLTPPATPPHQLWKPLVAVSLLGKAGSPKGSRLARSPGRPHRKTPAPLHVGSGEHDYCQLSAAPPKGGSRWNVKHNTDITIKPIKALTKQEPDQPATDRPLAAAAAAAAAIRMNPVGTVGLVAASQNSKEALSPVDACQDQTQVFSHVAASSSPGRLVSPLSGSTLTRPHAEPLDHRTSTPRSVTRGHEDPCSVLLSPAASPCRDEEEPASQQSRDVQQNRLASKRSLRCYRSRQKSTSPQKRSWRGRRNRDSRSFSSSSDGDSDSSSSSSSSTSSSSSRSCSRSLSPPSKRWRRYHSRSSRSSSSAWSRSRSRSRSSSCSSCLSSSSLRSPSPHRRSACRKRYDSSSSRDRYQRQKIRYKEHAIEERRVVFIGKISSRMTRSELRHRFSVFGDIEDCTLHFREQGDNYGFVTYRYAKEAFAAIEGGHALHRPDEQPFDLCFGGRRQFCKRNYVDLDSNREDFEPAPMKSKFDSLDFDTLLKQAQRSVRR